MSDDADSSGEEQEPTAKEGKSDEIFEVEKILEHDFGKNDKLLFRVRWAGYDESDDTWEPEEDLQECANNIVREYYRKLGVQNGADLLKIEKEKKKAAKQKKGNQSKAKKRERSPSPVSEEEVSDVDSEGSYSDSSKTKNKKKRSNKPSTSSSASKPKVQTKAAVKAYSQPSPAKAPLTPGSATQKARLTRSAMWASSDEEEDEDRSELSEFDKIASKVRPSTAPPSVQTVAPTTTPTSLPVQPQVQSTSPVQVAPPSVNGQPLQSTSTQSSSSNQNDEYQICGIAKHTRRGKDEMLILVKNKASNKEEILSPEDAFKLCGWTLTKYLLANCEF